LIYLSNMKLSIIIPTWNTAVITQKCVDSIIKNIPTNTIEIIIVDNCSTDNTQEIFSHQKKIKYIRNISNLGFSKACNIGAQNATGDYYLFLNSDMELIDNQLINMLNFYRKNDNIGLIGPKLLNIDLTTQGSIFPPQTPLNAFKEFWLNQKSYSKYYSSEPNPTKVWAISGGAVLIGQKLFEQVGGWNEQYYMFFEDLDLCKKLRNIGKDIYYYPQCQIIHRHGASGAKLSDSLNQWRRLIPSSKIYFGPIQHYLIFFITWTSQQFRKIGLLK